VDCLRYGIPQFKLEKAHHRSPAGTDVCRRREVRLPARKLERMFRWKICGATSMPSCSRAARNNRAISRFQGAKLNGIHFAMEYLPQQNRRCLGDTIEPEIEILAIGKRVVIIGGGDTGADCLGTCHRQKPLSVHQFEDHAEAARRTVAAYSLAFVANATAHRKVRMKKAAFATGALPLRSSPASPGSVKQLHAVRVGSPPKFEPIPGSDFTMEATWCSLPWAFWPGAEWND